MSLRRVLTVYGSGGFHGVGVEFTRDGRRLVISRDENLTFWQMPRGRFVGRLRGTEEDGGFAVSPNGRLVAVGTEWASGDQLRVDIWDIARRRRVVRLPILWNNGGGLAFCCGGRVLIVGAAAKGGEINVYDAANGRLIRTLSQPWSQGFVSSKDGQRILTLGMHTMRLWDAESGRMLKEVQAPAIFELPRGEFSRDGRLIALTADPGGNTPAPVYVLDARTLEVQSVFQDKGVDWANPVFVGGDSTLALGEVVSDSGMLSLLDWKTGTRRKVADLSGAPLAVAVSPDGRRLAVSNDDGSATVWELVQR